MMVLNFSHPLSEEAVQQATEQLGSFETRMVRIQLDMAQPLAEQISAAVDSAGLSPDEWQTQPFAVVLPGASIATGILLSEIHGRSGGFPRILSLISGEDRVFRLSEVIDLQKVRNNARTRR